MGNRSNPTIRVLAAAMIAAWLFVPGLDWSPRSAEARFLFPLGTAQTSDEGPTEEADQPEIPSSDEPVVTEETGGTTEDLATSDPNEGQVEDDGSNEATPTELSGEIATPADPPTDPEPPLEGASPEPGTEVEGTPTPVDVDEHGGTPDEGEEGTPIASPVAGADGAAVENGTLTIHKVDENGDPLAGACFLVIEHIGLQNQFVSGCDQPAPSGDGNADGTLVFDDLLAGDHTLHEFIAPTGYLVGSDTEFTISPGEETVVEFPNELGGQTLAIHKVDPNGDPLGGACFSLYRNNGGSFGDFVTSNCDGPSGGPYDGTTLIPGLPTGSYWLDEYRAPDGYVAGPAQVVTIDGGDADVTVENQPAGGPLVVFKVDQNGDPLPGACFSASATSISSYGFACDSFDGASDGTTTIEGLLPGAHQVFESTVPPGYVGSGPTAVTIDDTNGVEVTIENTQGGQLVVSKVDENGDPLQGTCFNVNAAGSGDFVAFSCDSFDGSNDGTIAFANLPAGDFTLGENFVPPGYTYSAPVPFSIDSGERAELTFENQPGGQTLFVHKTDTDGKPLGSACFQVRLDLGGGQQGQARAGGCDSYDGVLDGVVTLAGLAAGDYVLVETFAPFGYKIGAPVLFTIADGEDANLTVEDEKLQSDEFGSLVIRKVDGDGNSLSGSCFELLNPQDEEPVTPQPNCDGGFGDADGVVNGELVFSNNVRGSFLVHETKAPAGYLVGDNVLVTIDQGETVTVDVVNFPEGEEPPADAVGGVTSSVSSGGATSLPATGVGPNEPGRSASLLLGGMSLAFLGLVYVRTTRRRRA